VINTTLVKEGRPLPPVLEQSDEIGHLDLVFHEMAAALDEALRKERAVTQNVMDVICSLSDDFRIIQINPAATHTWGYELSEMQGRSLQDFVVQEDIERMVRVLGQLKSGEISAANLETRILCKNAEQRWMLWSIQWSVREATFYCVAHDINELKALEQLKQDFVNMITHDLKTPLMATQAFLDTLAIGAYGAISDSAVEKVRTVKGSLKRTANLIQQLLETERIRSGHLDLEFSKALVGSIIDSSIGMVEALAQEQGLKFICEGDRDLVITADKDRLVQVVQNLLSNAIKFSPPGSEIKLSWQVIPNKFLEVQVTDLGPGIDEKYKNSIFDRFQQAAQPNSTQLKGTGLGLAICKAIIEQHGGSIDFFNRPNQGTTFRFRLPLSPEHAHG
jgi:PAS domain S-box-containing protein